MRIWLTALVVFNLLDAISTIVGIELGYFYEANPAAAWLISVSPLVFLAVKVLVSVPLVAVCIRKTQLGPVFSLALKCLTVLYGILICWHIFGWSQV
jgi:hypothetical protein